MPDQDHNQSTSRSGSSASPDGSQPKVTSVDRTPAAPASAHSGGPLRGIRILDLSAYIAGPYGCTLLADLGAEVIKIESPGGDTLRQYPSTLAGESRAFLGTNRNKLGVVIDLKQPEGAAILKRMVETADVFVHNFRPSVPSRLGIDYPALKAANPRLIYCALTGFGSSGPLREKAGYDQVLQSLTGICTFQGEVNGKPEIVYGSVVDFYAAAMLAYSVASALFERERTGKGQSIGVSLLASALAMQSGRFIWAESEGRDVPRDMRSGGITGIHPTKEGDLYISANTPHFWRSLCELTGLSALAENPDYSTVKGRAQRAAEIVPAIRSVLMTKSAKEWEELFGDRVACAAIRPIEDMFDYPQVQAEGLVAHFEHPVVGRYRGLAQPIKFEESPTPSPASAPAFGQHTAEALLRVGYTRDEIQSLASRNVIVLGKSE